MGWTESSSQWSSMKALVGPNDHLRNHVQHLLQTHESYQIQWESRLNDAMAECAKKFKNFDRLSWIWRSMVMNSALGCAGLEHQTGLWLHNFLRSILNIIRIVENIRRFCTGWSWFNIRAFHNYVEKFVTATALEILRQMLSQYLQVRITFRAFVHMNQSLCTSWCFIKSIKIQITWSWMNIETRRES